MIVTATCPQCATVNTYDFIRPGSKAVWCTCRFSFGIKFTKAGKATVLDTPPDTDD